MKIRKFLTATALVVAAFGVAASNVSAQTAAPELEVSESMGLGQQSRFVSGAAPISIDRTTIVPGTPLSVSSTMQNIIASGGRNSFGGILARYDTANFGKLFGTGTMAQREPTNRVDELEEAPDNEVDNDLDVARMYPPRLSLDFNEFPTRALGSNEARLNLKAQIANVLSRCDFDSSAEEFRVETAENVVYLTGTVRTTRLAFLLESVLAMQPGVERVVNRLEITEPTTQKVDVFGRPIDSF